MTGQIEKLTEALKAKGKEIDDLKKKLNEKHIDHDQEEEIEELLKVCEIFTFKFFFLKKACRRIIIGNIKATREVLNVGKSELAFKWINATSQSFLLSPLRVDIIERLYIYHKLI